jgi:hypothetical protein
MPKAWSKKSERQYEHIKEGAKEQGSSTKRAKEIAARTVNKNRAQSGESKTASRSSTHDVSPQHRGGKRSGNRQGPGGPTKEQLYNEAKKKNIKGRSSMSKKELQSALGR